MRLFRSLLPLLTSTGSLLTANVFARSHEPAPINYVSLVEDPVINTPSHRVNSLSHFDVTFYLHEKSQRLKLTLEPNHDIFAEDAQITYLDAEGNVKHAEPIDRLAHRVFKGSAWVQAADGSWNRAGWARIYVKRDGAHPLFEGAFSVMHDQHHIELRSSYMQTKRESDVNLEDKGDDYMVVYRDSDMIPPEHSELKRSLSVSSSSCQADKLAFNSDPNHPVFRLDSQESSNWGSLSLNSLFGLTRRQSDIGGFGGNTGTVNLRSTIGSTAGCPTTKKVALIGVATDCSYTASFNSTETARQNIINVVNTASDLYERTFNITIGLRNLTVSDKECPNAAPQSAPWNMPCSSGNITSRLDLFSSWRGSRGDDNAYWTLMSNCPTGAEVGLSWLGQLCNNKVVGDGSQAVTGANVVIRTPAGWQVFAHETGHTFGAVHDCDSATCAQGLDASSQCCPLSSSTCDAGGRYIMNPSTGDDITQFSPCTVGNICSALGRNSVKSNCLSDNRGVVTITGSQCGNGIVESGEDCDCGGEESCGDNNCCDAKTCKFKNGAVCDDSNEACCVSCQFASANTVCRASTGPCDVEEKCTGHSSGCPDDVHVPDGQKCGNTPGLTCASGQCTSRDQQCQDVMGDLIHSNQTRACDSSSCSLKCASPNMPSNVCAAMNQNFLDGTPCSGGGHCSNGRCVGATVGNEVNSWVDDHKPLVIGLAAGLGSLVVLSILSYLWRSCSRPRQPVKGNRLPSRPGPYPVPPPPAMGQYRGADANGYWQQYPPPPYPPPAYGSPADRSMR
ncbi:hypothetical protein VTN02DRAFT_1838 [Thermoascus thermophilus]